MKRIITTALLLSAFFAFGTSVSFADDDIKRTTFSNPIIAKSVPDPTIIRGEDGYFYLFGTEDTRNMPIYRSKNLIDWVFVGTAFAESTRPRCVRKGTGADENSSAMMWAPDINYINGQYVLYFSIGVWGYGDLCGVGVATSDRPEGPYADRGVLFMATDLNVHNSIDQFFIQDNGKNYMIWGSFNGIYMIQLSDDGLSIMPGATKTQLAGSLMEASYVYKRNGYYYLFGSAGSCCDGASSTYHVVYGRSKNLAGPYVTKDGGRMLDNKSETLLSGNDFVAGPGHNAEFVEDDNGDTWIPYHGYLREDADKGRCVFLDKVQWEDDWPYMDSSCPTESAAIPYFKE